LRECSDAALLGEFMDRFEQALITVIEANQRFLLKRAALQGFLLVIAGVGLWQLSGAWCG
jgi:hypothetical protein